MSILSRLRADLQRSIAEHQVVLLTEVLRQRFAELTLGDLRQILTSQLGRGLERVRLAELAPSGAASKAKAEPVRAAGQTQAAGRRGPVSRSDGDYAGSILAVLGAASAPLTSGELRRQLGGSASTMYRALTDLIKAGRVTREGKPARYSLVGGAEAETSAGADAGANANAVRRGRPPVVSARTLAGRAQYDASVLEQLKQADGWIGASQLRAIVGGSDNQIRIALHRLVSAGQVIRRGERNSTEYRLSGRS